MRAICAAAIALSACARNAGPIAVNPDPTVPPQCYLRTEHANTCAACHTQSQYPNLSNDWELQQNYPFFELATNHWRNQFRERRALVSRFSDDALAAWVRVDNYSPLRATQQSAGWQPDLDFARGFDALGFAADGTGWRAIRYKPFSVFWPNAGSTDDAFIRLPAEFRRDARGEPSLAIYRINLAILEAAITADPARAEGDLIREVEPVDETAGGIDLDRDGALGRATRVAGLPRTFAGGAADIQVTRGLYPRGVELLHTVRYLDPDAPAYMARRMKEVRYATKVDLLEGAAIVAAHRRAEDPAAEPIGDPQHGYTNAYGWRLQGWIEDRAGWLRLQSHEEHQFCMGCHTNLGATIDQTFSFPRKVPGAAGWRPQDPRELADGQLYPSRARALELDRAYLANVFEQSYVWGRDSVASPVPDARSNIVERSTGLGETDRVQRETPLLLDWATGGTARSPASRR